MVIHKRKSHNDPLKLSLKAQYSVLASSTLATSAPLATDSEEINIEDDSKERIARINDDSVNLEDELEIVRRQTERCKRIYRTADAVIETLNHLSEIIKAKHEQNEAIVALYDNMLETHKIAVEKEALNQNSDFSELFDDIVRQSEECYVFLSNYIYKGRLYYHADICGADQVMDSCNSLSKIEAFNNIFEQLQKRFNDTQVEVTTVTVLYTQRVVESIDQKINLRPLEPSTELLGPKCHCLLGTRRSSLTKILDWCFYGGQSILWISGIAGCGKSSLIGTLHNSLSTLGFRSRLAAFIRFDRSSYRDAKEFVKALAFLLANFDQRFGNRILDVLEKSPQIAQNTELSTQVQKLLINPLRGLSEEITKEGRIVVLVDGIDECSRSDQAETNFRGQLLELFANDKFGLLPFLRFVLASRPEEDIVAYLQGLDHIHHIQLDRTSNETRQDICYFLSKSFQQHPSLRVLDNAIKSSAVELLAERASGLFIWAATVVGFIKGNVAQRMKVFTENEPPENALHALTVLYKTALDSLVNENGDEDIEQNICMALGLIMASPSDDECTIPILRGLSKHVDPENNPDILGTFQKLRSLVTEEHGHYELLHKSFDDCLTSKDQAQRWYISTEKYQAILYEAKITCIMDYLDRIDMELPAALLSDVYRYAIWGPANCVYLDLSLYPSLPEKLERFLLGYLVEKHHHDSEFMRKAWLSASRLRHIYTPTLVVKDFFNIMLYDAAVAGKVTKTYADSEHALEWEVDNIFMSVFVQMANGSNHYEEIVAVLDTDRT
ncbi:hypothetical protein VNI00_008832 [Paramarasmius palmivorus]|uniref:NACHT domain-containing protein n=1 Tax=Paramarasmius palmivorus TaxID=297713 RepID=A0AAW0CSY1_9AGAR